GDTYAMSNTLDGKATIICYNILDKVWWGLNCVNNGGCYIFPATAYPSNLTAGQYAQYFFRRTSAGTGNNAVSSTRPMSWVINGAEGSFYDDNPTASPTTEAISVAITWNTIWNATTKRKALRRISTIMDTLTKAGGDASVYTFYFLYNKSG